MNNPIAYKTKLEITRSSYMYLLEIDFSSVGSFVVVIVVIVAVFVVVIAFFPIYV